MEDEDKLARFDEQSLVFFGSKERAEAFWRLEEAGERLEAVWALPIMQDLLKRNNLRVHEKSLGTYLFPKRIICIIFYRTAGWKKKI